MDMCSQSSLSGRSAGRCRPSAGRCPSVRPSILLDKSLDIGHCLQNFRPNSLKFASYLDTVDSYHSIPLSRSLNLAGCYNVSKKARHVNFFFSHFSADWNEI